LPIGCTVVDVTRGEQHAPDFLKISPNRRIPAIVDPEGPGGQPASVFESRAILLYLAWKTGMFMPRDLAGRIPVWEWLMWQMGGFSSMPGQVHAYLQVADEADRRHPFARCQKQTHHLYGVLDRRLAGHDFVATEGEPSIADFAIVGRGRRHERRRVDLADCPNVKACDERMRARPGVQRGFAVPMRRAKAG
jgi:GST-like protein